MIRGAYKAVLIKTDHWGHVNGTIVKPVEPGADAAACMDQSRCKSTSWYYSCHIIFGTVPRTIAYLTRKKILVRLNWVSRYSTRLWNLKNKTIRGKRRPQRKRRKVTNTKSISGYWNKLQQHAYNLIKRNLTNAIFATNPDTRDRNANEEQQTHHTKHRKQKTNLRICRTRRCNVRQRIYTREGQQG